MNNEQKVIAYLIHSVERKDLKKYLNQLVNIKWTPDNTKIIKLCNQYTKLDNPPFDLADFMVNEFENKDYIVGLLDVDSVFSEELSEMNIEKLIEEQQETRLKNKLLKLKDKSVDEVLRDVKSMKSIRRVKPLSLGEVRRQRLIDREYEKLAPKTGFSGLDDIIKGFVSGHTITMTGDTNVGKTQMCCNFAYNVAKQGKRVLYFSLEPDITVLEYLASIWARKRFSDVTDDDLEAPKGIEIDVYTKEHVKTLEDMVNIVESSERYDLVIVDHFGYFTSVGNNKTQIESNAMKTMAAFSKNNKTCVLLVVHPRKSAPNRSKKQKSLSIQDISGSAAFSQDATDVLIVMRKKDEDDQLGIKYTGDGFIAVHKTKSGPNGACAIKFVPESALILSVEEYATEQAKLF